MSALQNRLASVVGEGNVLTGALPEYNQGARHDSGKALCVVRPSSTPEVQAVVAICHSVGARIVPQAGNTGLVGGSTPAGDGLEVVLSVSRLRQPVVVDRINRSATVSAGLRLSEVNAALQMDGLTLPIDLGADPMIGGMIAANTGGARFVRYGDVRRAVMGLEVVLPDADGTLLNLLRPLRKDNTGVDWKQLFIGTGGAFGVITRATIEVQRLPLQTATALVVPRDDEAITDILMAVEAAAQDHLTAFEGMSAAAMHAAFRHVPSLRNPFAGGVVPDFAILIELSRTTAPRIGEQALDVLLEAVLYDIWTGQSAPIRDAILGRGDVLWQLRHALSEGVKSLGPIAAFDLSFARGDVGAFRSEARAMLARDFPDTRVCDFGHVGDGALHFNVVWPETAPTPSQRSSLRNAVYALAVDGFGGSFSAEHGIGRINQDVYDRFTPERLRILANDVHLALGGGPMGALRLGKTGKETA